MAGMALLLVFQSMVSAVKKVKPCFLTLGFLRKNDLRLEKAP
jgi:hypothetical protein